MLRTAYAQSLPGEEGRPGGHSDLVCGPVTRESRIATSNAISNGIPGTRWDSLVLDGTTAAETQGRTGLVGTRRHEKDGGSSAHNPKVVGSNPTPATIYAGQSRSHGAGFLRVGVDF
jgi:hypothetical protein